MPVIFSISLSVPANGLVVYCGTIVTDDGKEKKVNIDFEPFKPINTSLYLCDNKFHTEVCAIIHVVKINLFLVINNYNKLLCVWCYNVHTAGFSELF